MYAVIYTFAHEKTLSINLKNLDNLNNDWLVFPGYKYIQNNGSDSYN